MDCKTTLFMVYTGSTSKAPKFLFLMARVLKHLKGATIPFLNRAPFKCFENRAVKNEKLGALEVEALYICSDHFFYKLEINDFLNCSV